MAVLLDLAQEGSRGQIGNREVPADRLFPPVERELPQRDVLFGPASGNRGADVQTAESIDSLSEELVDLVLTPEVSPDDRRTAELLAQRLRSLASLVVVEDNAGALRRELSRTSRADAARGAGDKDALALKPRIHQRERLRRFLLNGECALIRSVHVVESDAQLVARCRAGDDDAWRELVDRFSRYVYAISVQAFRLSEQDAEDVFQEVFARAYERLDRLRDDAAIRPWLAQLTRRLCLDTLRAGSREQPSDPPELSSGDDTIARLDEALMVHEALATLPDNCRDILDRFFARDESYKHIADALDLPAGTIASRISRCLVKLRGELEGRNPASTES